MDRLGWLLVALLVVPLADALFLVVVAVNLGWMLTVALVVLTALVGMAFVRAEGRHTMRAVRRSVAEGDPPTDELLDGALLLVAGAFLLTPGLVTDALGLLLVFRPTRYPFRVVAKKLVVSRLDERSGGFATGKVYTWGFPGDADPSNAGGHASGDAYDLDEDAYEVQFEEEDRTRD